MNNTYCVVGHTGALLHYPNLPSKRYVTAASCHRGWHVKHRPIPRGVCFEGASWETQEGVLGADGRTLMFLRPRNCSGLIRAADVELCCGGSLPEMLRTRCGIDVRLPGATEFLRLSCSLGSQLAVRQIFDDCLDKNRDGHCDRHEFASFMRSRWVGSFLGDQQIGLVFESIDRSGSGFISQSQFTNEVNRRDCNSQCN